VNLRKDHYRILAHKAKFMEKQIKNETTVRVPLEARGGRLYGLPAPPMVLCRKFTTFLRILHICDFAPLPEPSGAPSVLV